MQTQRIPQNQIANCGTGRLFDKAPLSAQTVDLCRSSAVTATNTKTKKMAHAGIISITCKSDELVKGIHSKMASELLSVNQKSINVCKFNPVVRF